MKPTNLQIGSKVWLKSPITILGLPKDYIVQGVVDCITDYNFYFDFYYPNDPDKHYSAFKKAAHLDRETWLYPTANDLIQKQKELGSFFTIWFIKKDGTERKINCRFGVKKHLHGGKSTVSEDKYWIVWDTAAKDYRAVNKETIFRIKCQGVVYETN